MAAQRIKEISTPEFIKIFGELSASKSLAMREILPAVSNILKSLPETIAQGVEEWRKSR